LSANSILPVLQEKSSEFKQIIKPVGVYTQHLDSVLANAFLTALYPYSSFRKKVEDLDMKLYYFY
jgi:hypothetical protein